LESIHEFSITARISAAGHNRSRDNGLRKWFEALAGAGSGARARTRLDDCLDDFRPGEV
jgi:hypothetical protein